MRWRSNPSQTPWGDPGGGHLLQRYCDSCHYLQGPPPRPW